MFASALLRNCWLHWCGWPAASGLAPARTAAVVQANANLVKVESDRSVDMEDAWRLFTAKPTGKITAADGTVLGDLTPMVSDGAAPGHPTQAGFQAPCPAQCRWALIKVTDGAYQLQGFDIANMTLIED